MIQPRHNDRSSPLPIMPVTSQGPWVGESIPHPSQWEKGYIIYNNPGRLSVSHFLCPTASFQGRTWNLVDLWTSSDLKLSKPEGREKGGLFFSRESCSHAFIRSLGRQRQTWVSMESDIAVSTRVILNQDQRGFSGFGVGVSFLSKCDLRRTGVG